MPINTHASRGHKGDPAVALTLTLTLTPNTAHKELFTGHIGIVTQYNPNPNSNPVHSFVNVGC